MMNFNTFRNALPPFLQQFDPFAVLEPKKVAGNSNDQNTDDKSDVCGSLLTIKRDAGVVDVFDNLYVTPQQVSQNTTYDVEFAKFLDKYEEEKVGKLIDIHDTDDTQDNKPDETVDSYPHVYPDEDIKVLKPKLVFEEEVDEDLIDELILDKSIENIRLKEMADITLNESNNLLTNDNDKDVIKSNSFIEDDKLYNNLKASISTNTNIGASRGMLNNKETAIGQMLAYSKNSMPINSNVGSSKVILDNKEATLNQILANSKKSMPINSNIESLKVILKNKESTISQILANTKGSIPTNSNNGSPKVILNKEPTISQMLATQNTANTNPTPENTVRKVLIETVYKDPKVFQKRRIIKPEKELSNYTKGATLHEKSIVLPQMMERLVNRKIAYDMRKNLPKKMLLDTGVTEFEESENEFMHKRETRQKKMEEFINHQQIGDLNVNLTPKSASTSKGILLNNVNKSNIDLNKVPSKDVKQHLLTMALKNNAASTSRINEREKSSEVLSPQILMENCNKTRLLEFERRKIFENFVRYGKLE